MTYRPPQTQKPWDGTRVPTFDVYSLDGLVAPNCWNQPQRILLKVEVQESGVTCLLPHDAMTLAKAPTLATNLADRKPSNLLVLVFTSSALSSEIKSCTYYTVLPSVNQAMFHFVAPTTAGAVLLKAVPCYSRQMLSCITS